MKNHNNLADSISRINTAIHRREVQVSVYGSKLVLEFVHLLYTEGCICSYKVVNTSSILVYLKYFKGYSVMRKLQIVSKSSFRKYGGVRKLFLTSLSSGSFYVVSTSLGLRTNKHCLLFGPNVGGEILCKVFI